MKIVKQEPALIISALVGLIMALLVKYLPDVQTQEAVRVVLEWLVPLLVSLIGGWLIRSRVTPVK